MRTCVICEREFQPDAWHPKALVCSTKCNELRMNEVRKVKRKHNTEIYAKACKECGTAYIPNKYSWHRQKYCSEKCAVRVGQRSHYKKVDGRDNQRWKSAAWKKITKEVKQRDGNKCKVCGTSDTRLNVHHIYHRTDDEKNDNTHNPPNPEAAIMLKLRISAPFR